MLRSAISMMSPETVVLVAGGTGGLGRAVSLAFLRQGAQVVTTYRLESEFEELKNLAGDRATRLTGYRVDVTNEDAVQQLIESVLVQKSRLDVLVNTVGAFAGGQKMWETETRIFDQMLILNVRPGFLLARAASRAMLVKGKGSIVNVAAKAALDHPAGLSAYAASKAAALAMMDSLAADLKGSGVRVNSILPSIIDTEPNRRAMPGADFAKWPKPEDIAKVILFLCSEEAKVIHGAAIPVYGMT